MTDETGPRFNKASVVGFVFLLALSLLALLGRVLTAHNQGHSWIDILSFLGLIVVGIALLILVLSAWFDWRYRVRVRTLTTANPAAFIGVVVTDPTLVSQVDEFAVQLTGRRSKVRGSSYVTLVADRQSIRIFNGSSRPREAASFPTSALIRATIGSSQFGIRMIPSLDLHFDNGETSTTVSVHLVRTGHTVPRFVRGNLLNGALQSIRTATGTTQ